jgi:hypothetical protein
MTDSFYKKNPSSFFYGKRGIIISDIAYNKNFKKGDIVYIYGKSIFLFGRYYKEGIEVESNSGDFEIISHNKIDIIKNNDDITISVNERNSKQSKLLKDFHHEKNVNNFKEFSDLIKKYSCRINNLKHMIVITGKTKLGELNLPQNIQTKLFYTLDIDRNLTLEQFSKYDIKILKSTRLIGKKKIQILKKYLAIAGFTFKND